MTPTSPTPADRLEPWGGLRNSLSKAYVAADIDNAIEFWRPRIEAEARQQERDRAKRSLALHHRQFMVTARTCLACARLAAIEGDSRE
jgi:hypothetical protein